MPVCGAPLNRESNIGLGFFLAVHDRSNTQDVLKGK
jgi:hypothetical protein